MLLPPLIRHLCVHIVSEIPAHLPGARTTKPVWNCSLMLRLHFHMLRILMLIDESIQSLGPTWSFISCLPFSGHSLLPFHSHLNTLQSFPKAKRRATVSKQALRNGVSSSTKGGVTSECKLCSETPLIQSRRRQLRRTPMQWTSSEQQCALLEFTCGTAKTQSTPTP